MADDLYDALGVSRGASSDDIQRAYRKLARKYHPDVSSEPEAEERFKELSEAYSVLIDPEESRSRYDRFGPNFRQYRDISDGARSPRPPPPAVALAAGPPGSRAWALMGGVRADPDRDSVAARESVSAATSTMPPGRT